MLCAPGGTTLQQSGTENALDILFGKGGTREISDRDKGGFTSKAFRERPPNFVRLPFSVPFPLSFLRDLSVPGRFSIHYFCPNIRRKERERERERESRRRRRWKEAVSNRGQFGPRCIGTLD